MKALKKILVLMAMIMTLFITIASVFAYDDTYPYKEKCPTGDIPPKNGSVCGNEWERTIPQAGGTLDGEDVDWEVDCGRNYYFWEDRWGFAQCECTSYAAYKTSEMGVSGFKNSYHNVVFGNGGHWGSAAKNIGVPVDKTPLPGDIAYWTSDNIGGVGHVAYVEKINFDNSGKATTVVITEYNYPTEGCEHNCFGSRTVSVNNPSGYIHFPIKEHGAGYYVERFDACYEMNEDCDFFNRQTIEEWKLIFNLLLNYKDVKTFSGEKASDSTIASIKDYAAGGFFGGGGTSTPDSDAITTSGYPDINVKRVEIRKAGTGSYGHSLTLNPGEKFDIETDVNNKGNKNATSFTINYHRSDDKKFKSSDKEVGDDKKQSLKAGKVLTQHKQKVEAPSTPGKYYIFVRVSKCNPKDKNEDNDISSDTNKAEYAVLYVQSPNLIVSNITINGSDTPAEIQPGQSIEIKATVKNTGGDVGKTTRAKYELFKADGTNIPGLTGDNFKSGELEAGESATHGGTFTAPTEPGAYYVQVCADYDNRVSESDESDNCKTLSFTIAGATPTDDPPIFTGQCLADEVQESSSACETHPVSISQPMSTAGSIDILPVYLRFSTGSYYFAPGSIADILADTRSTTDPQENTILEYYFTPGTTFDQNNYTYISGDTIKKGEISDGKTRTSGCRPFATLTFMIGDYTFGVMADKDQIINEASETNNWLTGLTIHVGELPDLEAGELRIGCKKSEFTEGETVTLELLVKNTGIDLPNDAIIKFTLTDQAAGIATEIGNITIPACSLQWRKQQVAAITFTAPKAGSYTVTACANPGNLFSEEKTDNNCASASMSVK